MDLLETDLSRNPNMVLIFSDYSNVVRFFYSLEKNLIVTRPSRLNPKLLPKIIL